MSCWILYRILLSLSMGAETFLSFGVQDLATVDSILLNKLPAASDKASVS